MFLCDSLWFGFFCQIKEQHPQPASLIFCFELPTGSLFLQNVRNWSLLPCKWMSDIGHVCSIYLTLCRSPALPQWPLRGGATFRPRSLACQGMLKKRINQSRLQIQLNFLSTCAPTFPSSSDTDKHTCYSLSSCLALTHSLILGIWRVAMQTITKELLLRHWCTESAYFPCTPAFGYSCDDSHHLMQHCFCFISPSWLKRRGNSVVGFWFVFQSSL